MEFQKKNNLIKARRRNRIHVRTRVIAQRPRLSVFRSNYFIYAQVIDDKIGKTVAQAASREFKDKITKVAAAEKVGELVAERAIKAGVKEVVFDRGSYLYHGRVKALAESARKKGLIF